MTSDNSLEKGELQARLLAEALPYMQRYENKTIVVKYGGHAMGDISLGRAFARDCVPIGRRDGPARERDPRTSRG